MLKAENYTQLMRNTLYVIVLMSVSLKGQWRVKAPKHS